MENNNRLSQDEIDALLKGGDDTAQEQPESGLSLMEQDTIGEIGNISFGSSATALSTLLNQKVEITTPTVSVIEKSHLNDEFPHPYVSIGVSYTEGFSGNNLLVIKQEDAAIIADLMMGGDGTNADPSLGEIHLSAVQEAMNQMMGSSATSMSTIFNRFVNISPPGINILDVNNGDGVDHLPPVDVFIKISFHLTIGDLIDSTIMQLLPVSFAKQMVATLMGEGEEAPPAQSNQQPAAAEQEAAMQQTAAASATMPPPAQQPAPAAYAQPAPGYDMPPVGPAAYGGNVNRNVNVQPVQFANFGGGPNAYGDGTNLNLLLDIPLKVTVELGRTQKQIKDILELSQGSIIELDKLAGEPVDILVNNKLIAKGEVVVIDENFGVRVTDIVSQWDRIQKLQ